MAQKPSHRNYRVRYDRILYCAIILVVMILLLTSCITKCGKSPEPSQSDSSGATLQNELTGDTGSASPVSPVTSQSESLPVVTEAGVDGYKTVTKDSDAIHYGNLILGNSEYPVEFDEDEVEDGTSEAISFATIKSILDTKPSPKHYTAADWEVGLDRTAALAMDAWFEGFYSETKNTDLRMIRGYAPGSSDQDFHTGRTLTIGIYPESGSSNFYSPEGDYAWLADHASEYGFIQRYPDGKDDYFDLDDITDRRTATYRYVGIAPATYITTHELCLEEFIEEIKNYSIDSMLQVTSGDAQYGIYYIPAAAAGEATTFSVPTGDTSYEISGNNADGFIITVALNEAAASKSKTTVTQKYDDISDEELNEADDED